MVCLKPAQSISIKFCVGLLAVASIWSTKAQGYSIETISFKTRTNDSWYRTKNYILEVYATHLGRLAKITSNKLRSEKEFRFSVEPFGEINENDNYFEKLKTIRTEKETFDPIGYPQFAHLIRVKGVLFGLVLTTRVEPEPELLATIETEDLREKEEFLQSIRRSKGVSGTFGTKLGGAYLQFPYDAAVLVNLNGAKPEILKVYEIDRHPQEGYSNLYNIHDAVCELANYDLAQITKSLSCKKTLFD